MSIEEVFKLLDDANNTINRMENLRVRYIQQMNSNRQYANELKTRLKDDVCSIQSHIENQLSLQRKNLSTSQLGRTSRGDILSNSRGASDNRFNNSPFKNKTKSSLNESMNYTSNVGTRGTSMTPGDLGDPTSQRVTSHERSKSARSDEGGYPRTLYEGILENNLRHRSEKTSNLCDWNVADLPGELYCNIRALSPVESEMNLKLKMDNSIWDIYSKGQVSTDKQQQPFSNVSQYRSTPVQPSLSQTGSAFNDLDKYGNKFGLTDARKDVKSTEQIDDEYKKINDLLRDFINEVPQYSIQNDNQHRTHSLMRDTPTYNAVNSLSPSHNLPRFKTNECDEVNRISEAKPHDHQANELKNLMSCMENVYNEFCNLEGYQPRIPSRTINTRSISPGSPMRRKRHRVTKTTVKEII